MIRSIFTKPIAQFAKGKGSKRNPVKMEAKPVETPKTVQPASVQNESTLFHQKNTHLDYKPYPYHLKHNDPNSKTYVASERDTYK